MNDFMTFNFDIYIVYIHLYDFVGLGSLRVLKLFLLNDCNYYETSHIICEGFMQNIFMCDISTEILTRLIFMSGVN
jgi:hypothetical protein